LAARDAPGKNYPRGEKCAVRIFPALASFERPEIDKSLVRGLLQNWCRRAFDRFEVFERGEGQVMRKAVDRLILAVFLAGLAVGCSTQTKTVTTETREYPAEERVVDRRTETATETRSESGGVLSSTVDVVGDVLSLPFRAVAGLLQGIF
jgi:hypothetical protein